MKLRFKDQPFQVEAAAAVCGVFAGQPRLTASCRREPGDMDGRQVELCGGEAGAGACNHPLVPELTRARLLENLRAVQRRSGLRPSDALAGPGVNLTVEMETGVGKTYTYIKTIYELNQRYGWSRFIIVVPSVAIREGVYKSLEITREKFASDYGKKLRFFIYNSDKLYEVDRFASDTGIQVMIINMQAFNSSKNQRIIDKKPDSFRSRSPMEVVARTNPILVIDEPQSVEGRQTKESLKKFNALFTLRYSATHKERYDMVYRLDAMDAFNLRLVKRIETLGVSLTGSTGTNSFLFLEGVDLYRHKPPIARLGYERKSGAGTQTVVKPVKRGDNLQKLSGGLEEYADRYVVTGIDGRDNSVTFLNGLKLYAGQIQGSEKMIAQQRRLQIRETILIHLRRERELYPRGIKVLSLFFIDEVSKYRAYDGDSDDGRAGEYAGMFEEEYESIVSGLQREVGDEAYLAYLDGIDPHSTHQGYFSIDKKRGKKARFVESRISDKKTQTSDDAEAYDLIMKDKERLLSLDEPIRFLFSHSALREGWDNPNVFQICTLKHQGESEIRGRQEIGRGLRLCVDQRGERMDESVLGGEVHELNRLTVITDRSYEEYVRSFQAGLAEALADRPRKVEEQLFLNKTLTNTKGERVKITRELAGAIYEDLIACGYVRRGELTEQYYADRDRGCVRVSEEIRDCSASLIGLLSTVYDPRHMLPGDASGGNITARVDPEKLGSPEFRALWERIRQKSCYRVDFDAEELVRKAIGELDLRLEVPRLFIRKERGEQTDTIESREQLLRGEGFRRTGARQEPGPEELGDVRYDLVGKLVEETGLTRAAVAEILQGMAPQKFQLFRRNPEEFILKAARIINHCKARAVMEHITYQKLDEVCDDAVFTPKRGRLDSDAVAVERCLYDYAVCDSAVELEFVRELDIRDEVAVYVKLPKSFFIPTPVGRYTPDWAIAFRGEGSGPTWFVAETKGSDEPDDLRGVEEAKVACARAHFAAISGGSVRYEVVTSVSQLMELAL